MKGKRFKLERKILEEVRDTLHSYNIRAKLLSSFIAENYVGESFYNLLLVKYQNTIMTYSGEIISILSENGKSFLVSEQQIEKFGNYKKILNSIEETINDSQMFSLKVH